MSNISHNANYKHISILLEPSISFLALSYTVIAIAILLNSLEIKLIVRKIKKATDFEILLLNLAIADLFNSIMFIVLIAITDHYAKNGEPFEKRNGLHISMAILSFSITVSITFVAIIGIERFFAIKVPLQHRMWHTKRKRLVKYTILAWIFNVVLIIAIELFDALLKEKNVIGKSDNAIYFTAGLMSFGLVLTFALYTCVIYLMLKRSLKLFAFDKKIFRVNPKRIKDAMKKEKSSIIVCILVVVSSMVCNAPVLVDLFQFQVTKTSAILLKISAITNPLIYFFKGYLERCYGKRKLVSSSKEHEGSKENGKRGRTKTVEFDKKSERVTGSNQTLNDKQIVVEVIENPAADDGDSGGNEGRK